MPQLTVKECILISAPKSCEHDPIPSILLIECLDSILPSLTYLFNSSLASGIFPCFKSALVTPILKKGCLNHNDLNYRPASNLFFITKILEKLVSSHVSSYLNSHNLYNNCQSAYRQGHRTEAALLKVVNDLFLYLSKGNISVLTLLLFSSAFDTIDHPILVHRLHTDIGFTDAVLQWLSSYLTDRTHYISLFNNCSAFAPVPSSVPQGSVLGPMVFTMHIKPLSAIIGTNIARTCYSELRRFASIRRFLTSTATATLESAFVLSRIDYCNLLLFGSTHDVTSHLQRIHSYAARVILCLPKSSSITTHLK